MVETTESPDEARERTRRVQILDAATRVFAARGFHGATIRDIARDAGIADGTIYLYFPNKVALLLGILDRVNETERRAAHFAAYVGADREQFTRDYVRQRLATFTDTGLDVFRALLPEVLTNTDVRERYYREIIAPTFATAEAADGLTGGDTSRDARLALRAVAGMVLGTILLRLMGDPLLEAEWDAVPDALADLLINGFAPAQSQGATDGAPDTDPDIDRPA